MGNREQPPQPCPKCGAGFDKVLTVMTPKTEDPAAKWRVIRSKAESFPTHLRCIVCGAEWAHESGS